MQPRLVLLVASAVITVVVVAAVPAGDAAQGRHSRAVACTPRWRTVPSPSVENGTLQSVAARSVSDAWAVGGTIRRKFENQIVAATPLVEHWDGTRWSIVAGPREPGALTDVVVTSPRDAWAVGSLGKTLRDDGRLVLRWNGRRWSRVSLPPTVRATAISARRADDVWVVGGSDVHHWNGSRWTLRTTVRGAELRDIAVWGSRDVWAVGRRAGASLVLHWNGSSWRSFRLGRADWLATVAAAAPTDVWVAGADEVEDLSPGAMYPVMFHWDGTRWMRVDLPSQVDTGFNALASSPTDEVWATSENPYDYALDGGAGSSVWHRASGRWSASGLADGWVLSGLSMIPAGGASGTGTAVWAVGQVGSAPDRWEGYFPARTVPLIRRFGC